MVPCLSQHYDAVGVGPLSPHAPRPLPFTVPAAVRQARRGRDMTVAAAPFKMALHSIVIYLQDEYIAPSRHRQHLGAKMRKTANATPNRHAIKK
eukprot:3216727-Pleurochrysis_carterae.AAC.1